MPAKITDVLNIPAAYTAMQQWLGFAAVRKKAIDLWLKPQAGERILDIGCGPGHITEYLPQDIEYSGFDIDANYIDQAQRDYKGRGDFYCRVFDNNCVEEFGDADIVMLNGVLHHMDDDDANTSLAAAHAALKPGGRIFTLDGCYVDGQGKISKMLLDMDRGKFVRSQGEYEALLGRYFTTLKTHMRDDLSTIPYNFIIMIGTKDA